MEACLHSVITRFDYYKTLAEKTFDQLDDEGLFWRYNDESNSMAMIVQHVSGNMLSRWTDFLHTDGEKPWRNRDEEFDPVIKTRRQLLEKWNAGWDCMFNALNSIKVDHWEKKIYIRNEPHTVVDAINRQLAHIPYRIGQIVFIGKMIAGEKWNSLSVPKEKSVAFITEKFAHHGHKKTNS